MRIRTALWALVLLLTSAPAFAQNARGVLTLSERPPTSKPTSGPVEDFRGGNPVVDPSFEAGRPPAQTAWVGTNPAYLSGSPIFGPPVGGPDLARTGSYYAVLGSSTAAINTGITQQVTATAGSYTLNFYLLTGVNAGSASEFFVTFNGVELVRIDATEAADYTADYVLVSVPVTVAANGTYALSLLQTKPAGPLINWFVDDVTLDENAVGPSLTITPSTVAFGDVSTGTTSAAQTVTLANNGTAAVTISSITGSGGAFTVTQTGTDLTLDPGQSTTFTVTFSPTAAGPSTGSITVTSNAAGSPATITLTGNGAVAPPNDNFANATVISAPGTVTGSNVQATLEAGEVVPSCQEFEGASVWWSYTPTANGTINIDLSASDVDDFDTVLTIFAANGTTELGCNDDGGAGFTSLLANVPVTAGQTVYIRVSGYTNVDDVTSTGPISFTLTVGGVLQTSTLPAGDTTGDPTWNRPSSVGTGASGGCALSGVATATPYETRPFTVTTAAFYTITTITSTTDYDGYILLYRGAFNPADPCLNLIALDDDGTDADNDSQITTSLAAGTYTLVVTGFSNGDFGAYTGTIVGPGSVGFAVAGEQPSTAARTSLTASPNPVRSAARVRLAVETAQDVTVAVFDVTGRQIATLFQGAVTAGQSLNLGLDASSLPAGVYVVRASGDSVNLTQRVTVVR